MLALQTKNYQRAASSRLVPTLLAAAVVLAMSGAARADEPAALWEAADTAYAQQKFTAALAGYEQLAAQGDARAAELAGQMHYYADALYGKTVVQDMPKAARWLKQAASAGRETARPLLVRLEARLSAASADQQSNETPYIIGPHGC